MTANAMDVAITSRMSIRAFTRQAVSRSVVVDLLQTAALAASDIGKPAWNVHVLEGESRNALCEKVCAAHDAARADAAVLAQYQEQYDYYPGKWFTPYLERRRENGWGLYGLLGIGKADKDRMHTQHQRNFRFFDAPVGLIFTVDRSRGGGSLLHYGAFLQSVMVAARGHGLHTCPQAAWNGFARIILSHIGAKTDDMLVCGMALGFADLGAVVNTFHTPRLSAAEFTQWRA